MMFVNKNQVWEDKICFDCICVTKGVLHFKKNIEENATELQVKKDKDIFINSYTYPSQLLVYLILWNAL